MPYSGAKRLGVKETFNVQPEGQRLNGKYCSFYFGYEEALM
jgi:hypothetical protein